MDKDKISVIVPVYNTKEYIEDCVKSILSQTYKKIELILVDDGSTDGSADICDMFKRVDKRVIVVHKRNEGVSAARNDGLNIASGEYFAFVDSDDIIEPNMYELLIKSIQENRTELAMCKIKCGDKIKNIKYDEVNINNLKKNKFKNDLYFLLVVLFACAFHKAAIIAILLPFIRKFKINKNRLILTGLTGLLMFLIAGPLFKLLVILLPKYDVYSNSVYAQSNYFGVLLKLLLSSSILCFSFYYFSDNQFKFIKVSHVQNNYLISNPELSLQFNCYNMYNLILYLSLSMVVFERLSFYFMIFAVVLIPNIFGRIRNKTKQQLIIVFSIFLIYFLSISIIRPNWDGCIPYKFF